MYGEAGRWGSRVGDFLEDRCRCEDMLKWNEVTGSEGMDCIHLAQDTDKWHSVVNMVMNLQVQ
jgi:hypothetical protein